MKNSLRKDNPSSSERSPFHLPISRMAENCDLIRKNFIQDNHHLVKKKLIRLKKKKSKGKLPWRISSNNW